VNVRGPVLVGTDLTEAAAEALRAAAELARGLDSRLAVCHVMPELSPAGALFEEFRTANRHVRESMSTRARAAVQAQLESVLGPAVADVDVVLESGSPHAGLLRQAERSDAGVVVVWPGSTAVEVARHARTTVLVTRQSRSGPVVAATDFSDPELPAVHAAAAEARRRGTSLHLLHALDIAPFAERRPPTAAIPYLQDKSWIALEGLDQLRGLATRRLADALQATGLPGDIVVVAGSAADVIVDYAETAGAALVVVGTHGRGGLPLLMLGSTATRVIEHASSSVMVVRLDPRGSSGTPGPLGDDQTAV
jgi:nucleotide-binding universal stress UspA family protein